MSAQINIVETMYRWTMLASLAPSNFGFDAAQDFKVKLYLHKTESVATPAIKIGPSNKAKI
jgi:hypothetical protein